MGTLLTLAQEASCRLGEKPTTLSISLKVDNSSRTHQERYSSPVKNQAPVQATPYIAIYHRRSTTNWVCRVIKNTPSLKLRRPLSQPRWGPKEPGEVIWKIVSLIRF